MTDNISKWGFGSAPISKVMQGRYDSAVSSVLSFLETNDNSGVDAESISEVKGMFNRCVRKDQWDWFSVYEQLGSPTHHDSRQIVLLLVNMRRFLQGQEPDKLSSIRSSPDAGKLLRHLQAFEERVSVFSSQNNGGWIYVLCDKRQLEILKIGMTTRSVTQRVKEINAHTGVLFPLSPRAVFRVANAAKAERLVFSQLAEYRMRADREFFQVDFVTAVRIIEECLDDPAFSA